MLTVIAVAASAGCSSPLTSMALREFLLEATTALAPDPDADEKIAADAAKPIGDASGEDADADDTKNSLAENASDGDGSDGDTAEDSDAGSRDTASIEGVPIEVSIERSLERLARTGGLEPAAQDVLVETLEKSDTADWPAIIDSFAASLETAASLKTNDRNEAAPPTASLTPKSDDAKPIGGLTSPVDAAIPASAATPVDAKLPAEATAASADQAAYEEPTSPSEPAKQVVPATASQTLENTGSQTLENTGSQTLENTGSQTPGITAPETPERIVTLLEQRLAEARRNAPLAVRRACFASKVRGWGSIDAFDDHRFSPGQSVLVYVEVDNLVGIETERGTATRLKADLRLLDAGGQTIEVWDFPPVEDTSDSPRTDYFVRYLVRIPDTAAAGSHQLGLTLTDTVSSKTVTTELPLEVADDAADNRAAN